MTTPALSPSVLAAARWLAGQLADSLAGVDGEASMASVRAIDGGNALEVDGQPVYAGDLAGGALLAVRVLVRDVACRSGRTGLEVALHLGALLDRHVPADGP